MKKGFIIAIDGPVASGKGTIAKRLAAKINAINFNSGGIWRAYTYKLLHSGVTPGDSAIDHVLSGEVEMEIHSDGTFVIHLHGEDITNRIVGPAISTASSEFGLQDAFARFIIDESRRIATQYVDRGETVIMEGRQIGTEVFPDAHVKIYLTADLATRAQRRLAQYKTQGIEASLDQEIQQTKARDENDMNRAIGALPRNPQELGYEIVDDSHLTEDQTLETILGILEKKGIYSNKE